MARRHPLIRVAAAAVLAATTLGGCMGEHYHNQIDVPVTLPDSYTAALDGATTSAPDNRWWQDFGLPGLDEAIEQAFERNLEFAAAWVRIEQSRTVTQQTETGWWPTLDASATVSRSRNQAGAAGAFENNNFQLSLNAGYEIDLWGRTLASHAASEADAAAAAADTESIAISLSAQITEAWLDVLYHRERRRLVESQLETANLFLDLTLLRLRVNLASAVDVLQQQQNVESLQSRLPLIDSDEQVALLRLSTLTGRPATSPPTVPGDRLPAQPPSIGAGVPADLLERRPDVRAARHRVSAADSRIVVAVADRLPSIRLSASIFLAAADPVDLFDDIFWNLAATLTAPLFDGGRRSLEVERTELVLDERVLSWGQTVLQAIEEVQTALVRERQLALYVEELEAQYQTAERSLDAARRQFAAGVTDYNRVLSSLVTLQTLETTILDARRQMLSARVALYRALGGSWTRDLDRPAVIDEIGTDDGDDDDDA